MTPGNGTHQENGPIAVLSLAGEQRDLLGLRVDDDSADVVPLVVGELGGHGGGGGEKNSTNGRVAWEVKVRGSQAGKVRHSRAL